MKDSIKDNWNNINEFTGIKDFTGINPDQFRRSRSGTVYNKVRNTVITDLVIKIFFTAVIALDFVFYYQSLAVVVILASILILSVITSWAEISALKDFATVSDPAQSSRNNLASMLTFLERKSFVPVISMAATQVIIFISGLLFYFELFYGYLKHISLFSFFVFGTLCMIGVVTSLIINLSQVNYHKKHLRVCLSDLNENTLVLVANNIEESRKKDATIKFLMGIAVIFGLVALLVLLKAVIT